ncbi:DUF5680 domain-containing protein [Inhella proteolytica]|uniref:DUF5680 domain-containing protein n=1 Tax=Inhella proteolytica TaxID=2795029 RepID=A0A931NIB2_9BURK|nr:DUF5680 domain-containing protein [Inhella proteolytica]MBH9578658.1 hypothetical protein [Inhella proteolytica]
MNALSSEFTQFLRAAKAATYAGQGDEASVTPALQDSKQLEHRAGAFLYRDIYVGLVQFVGQEIVYLNNRAIWSMSYSGGLIGKEQSASFKPVYAFLRQALLSAPPEFPVRGPASLQAEQMLYTCTTEGSLEGFHGVERITQSGSLVYELRFNGGSLA